MREKCSAENVFDDGRRAAARAALRVGRAAGELVRERRAVRAVLHLGVGRAGAVERVREEVLVRYSARGGAASSSFGHAGKKVGSEACFF